MAIPGHGSGQGSWKEEGGAHDRLADPVVVVSGGSVCFRRLGAASSIKVHG